MTAIVTAAEMRAAEAAAIAGGTSETDLMRRAGEQIASWIDDRVSRTGRRHAVALVGPGNNGGDALVALALLHSKGWRCSSVSLGRTATGSLPVDAASLSAIQSVDVQAISEADVVLDGVFGLGGRAEIPHDVARVFQVAWRTRIEHRTPMVAIDVPSGTDATNGAASPDAFRADVSLCLGLVKRGVTLEPAASHAGELVVLPIGIDGPVAPRHGQLISRDMVQATLPRRNAFAHKSDAGTLLLISGAPGYYGAPRLAAEAAMRTGAGLVALAAPQSIVPVIASQLPEAVYVGLPADITLADQAIESFMTERRASLRTVVVGPGIGRGEHADAMMRYVLGSGTMTTALDRDSPPALVVDADALNWLSEHEGWPGNLPPGTTVLTPHAGEMARLLGIDRREILADPVRIARDAAQQWRQYVVLKVGFTLVADPAGDVWMAPRATPELATAGTGDVLAGMIGGLLAQGLSLVNAAICGVWLGAVAGHAATTRQASTSIIARDVIDMIGHVANELQSPVWNT